MMIDIYKCTKCGRNFTDRAPKPKYRRCWRCRATKAQREAAAKNHALGVAQWKARARTLARERGVE